MQQKPIRVLIAMGTRPEIIKLAPLVHAARNCDAIELDVCHSGQHLDLAEPMLDYFEIEPDINLHLMEDRPTLTQLAANCLLRLEPHLARIQYDAVVVQGDTATACSSALAAFYANTPVIHIEAGLRTHNMRSPWPEEFNRRMIGLAGDLHCAATQIAMDNLLREGVPHDNILLTGNTVVDALKWALKKEREKAGDTHSSNPARQVVLITAHRRENFGEPIKNICRAISHLADRFNELDFVCVSHPNPNAGPVARQMLASLPNVSVVEPLGYCEFVQTALRAKLIISDSGGVQEEAPTLGVPLLITRDTTERPEAVHCGAARLIGTETDDIISNATELLRDETAHAAMCNISNPFGDGKAAERVVHAIVSRYGDTSLETPAISAFESPVH